MYVNKNPATDPLYAWPQEGQQTASAIGLKQQASDAEVVMQTMAQVSDLVARVERLADKLVGPVPEDGHAGGYGNVEAAGVFGELRLASDRLTVALTRGHEALSRIDRRI